jgi:NTP pyrophosphatase (non-canonical NTP hydrolase)
MSDEKEFMPVLEWFKDRMAAKLGLPKNLAKRHWSNDVPADLLLRLKEETDELENLLEIFDSGHEIHMEDLINEAADVANFAMMIADNARRLRETSDDRR